MQFETNFSKPLITPPRAHGEIGDKINMQQRSNEMFSQRWQNNLYGQTNNNNVMVHPTQTRCAASLDEPQFVSANSQDQSNATTSFKSVLSGEILDTSTSGFHNNMVPFFGSRIRQSVDADNSKTTYMEVQTGSQQFNTFKHEIQPLFQPEKNMTYVHGTPAIPTQMEKRFIKSSYRQSEKPFESKLVGPGLNEGYTSKPSGGFHQADTRDYVMPKCVDELRTLNNPKVTYNTPVIPGKSTVNRRGIHSKISKNKPDRDFKNSPARYMTTVGAVTGERHRSQPMDKRTNRQFQTKEYTGSKGLSSNQTYSSSRTSGYTESSKHNFKGSGFRNAEAAGEWAVKDEEGDYGKRGMEILPNERETTQSSKYLAGAVGIVKALIAPIEDVFRTTRKENVIGNPRQSGNMQVPIKKPAVHDPNDTAKTTIKETNVHNKHEGFVGHPSQKGTVYDPQDIARTTVKETNIHNNRKNGVLKGPVSMPVYDPKDITQTQITETNIHNEK